MFTQNRAAGTYGSVQRHTIGPREAEARLLSRYAAQLAHHSEAGSAAFPALVNALHENRRLWETMAMDLAEDGNALPDGLRAQIVSIAGFVLRQTAKVLSREGSVEALIDINRALARGLCAEAQMSP